MLFDKVFNKVSSVQELGMIPKVYQITDRPVLNEYINSILTYKGCNITMAANFKTQARLVKTFSKILNPGDTLDFRMTHHLGPGIRLDVARVFMMTSRKGHQPSGYFQIVEAEGTPCEGQELETGSIYQGSCPGWYNYEYSTGIKAVKHNSILSSSSTDLVLSEELEGNDVITEYAVKVYEREFLDTPPISFAAADIGEPGEKGKKFSVFSTSDERIVYSKSMYKKSEEKTLMDRDFDEVSDDEVVEQGGFDDTNINIEHDY